MYMWFLNRQSFEYGVTRSCVVVPEQHHTTSMLTMMALACSLSNRNMETVKYIVKARDNKGHEFIKTFLHRMTKAQMTAAPPEGLAVLQKMIQQYQDEVLSAVPFCCVVCGRAADALFHMPTAHLQGADPVVFDIPTPYCGSSACEDFAMAKAKAAAGNLGIYGSRRRFAESCTGAEELLNIKI